MNVVIGKSTANGTVTAPPSKSYAHRLLIGAALSRGTSTIENVCLSDDIRATLDCAQTLGATVSFAETPVPQTVRVCGTGGKLLRGGEFFCRESGSTLRFFLPLALCALSQKPRANAASSGKAIFRCSPRLAERGIGVYEEALKNAASFEKITENGNGAITVSGTLLPGKYTIRGNVSSQFATGLLFALPLLPENSELEILPPAESESYIAVTADVLKKFGVCIEKTAQNTWFIGGNQHFSSGIFRTEGDESNAAFFKALNALGGNVIVTGLNKNSLQGDKICDTLFKQLSAGYTEADLKNCPDLAPVLFAVAAAKHGARFSGTRRLKIKESDRAEAMREELAKFGAAVTVTENEVTVLSPPCGLHAPESVLSSHGDHRIAMALSLLCTITGGMISGAEAVRKSYPDFFSVLSSLGVSLRRYE